MFKSIGYSPGFLLKIGQLRTLANSPEIHSNSPASNQKYIYKHIGVFSGSLERFPTLAKIRHVQKHGLQPRLLPKIGQARTLANSPEIHSNSPASTQKTLCKNIGVLSESLERFPTLAKIRHVQKHGLQPRLFAQNRPRSDPSAFTRNPFKQSRKHLEIHLQAYRSPFRKFGAISNTCQNPPCSKAWAIAQAFCSKSAKLGHQRIHPQSIQIVPQALRNPFTSIQESFQKVWSDFQHLPKSAMFKSMGYSPGFLLKIGQVRTLAHSPEIHSNSPASTQKSICKHIGVLSESLERFPTLAKIRHVQKHGLQPRLFAQNRPSSDTSEFTRNPFKQSRKHLEIHLQAYRSPFRKFGAISNTCQNPPCSKAFAIAQAFAQNRPISDPSEFTRNRFKQSRKHLESHLKGYRSPFRKFGAISNTCQNPPCSKPWAIAQAFCSKSAKLGPQRIHPKSIQIVPQAHRNQFASIQESFQKVWEDFQHLPKSAMFKSMGYSPGFLLKIGQARTLANSPAIHSNSPASTQKSIYKHIGVLSESLERFPTLAKIRHVQKHGLQPRLFAQNRPSSDPSAFTRNPFKQSRKHLEIHLQAYRSPFRKFGAISNTCQNPPCSKAWAIAQAFCSKSAKLGHQRIHPKSIQIVPQALRNPFTSIQESFQKVWSDFQHLPKSAMFKSMGYSPGFLLKIGQVRTLAHSPEIHSNSPASTQKSICKHIGVLSESLERFPTLAKIRHVQKHGLQPRLFAQNRPSSDTSEFTRNPFKQSRKHFEIHLQAYRSPFRKFGAISNTCQNPPCSKAFAIAQAFAQNRPISDPSEFTRNRFKQSRKHLESHLKGYRSPFRKFGAISNTCQNPPCSKPWAIAQAFCSKSAKLGPQRIHPKSIQIVPQAHRNPFASIQESFQKVWEDFQHLPKSAMFKSMGYSPGFLLKIGQARTLANSPAIHSNSPASTQKSIYKHIGVLSESLERFPTLAKIRHVQKHGLQPRLFAQNRPSSDPSAFTRNPFKQSRKHLEIHLQAYRSPFRKFGAISNTCQNPPCSKAWAIAQAFCSKSAKLGHQRIHPKSIQIVPQALRNPFASIQESFQKVWSDFQHLPKSAMFKSICYSPGFCSKSPNFGPQRIHPKSIQIVPQALRKPFERIQESFQKVWSDFQHLPKSAMFKTMGYSPGFLLKIGQARTLANSPEIHSNSPASTQKSICKHIGVLSESLGRFPTLAKIRHVQKHGLQPRLFAQNRPTSDPGEFTRNPFKQSRKQLEIHLQAHRSLFRKFGAISNTCENPPCSKAWAIAQAFAQNRPSSDPSEFTRNPFKQSRKHLENLMQVYRSPFRKFGAISNTCQNPPCSKAWAIAQAFCSKSAKLGPQRIHSKSIKIVPQALRNPSASTQESFQKVWSDFQHLPKSAMFKSMSYSPGFLLKIGQVRTIANSPEIHSNSPASTQKYIYKHIGVFSGSLERFPTLSKIRHVQKHLLQPRLFAQNRPSSDPSEFTRNPFKQSGKHLEIHLQAYRSPFRKFGAISNTCQNPPCSKAWAIAQAFCSKSAKFGPQRIHPKSVQIVPQALRNPFASIQESFQKVWSDFQHLPKSAMFKSMGYSPGFLLKIGQARTLANSPAIHSNSPASTQKSIYKHIGVLSESLERFPTLAKIRHVQKHGLQPRLFAQNRPSSDPSAFTRNPFKQSRKHLEIHLQAYRSPFRKFGAISNTCQNPPCSKAWAIAQAFCSKSAKLGHQRIHPKSIQIVPQALRNPFASIQESFQKVWSDFQHLPKSAMFKTMGYSPGFLLKIGQARTLANSPEIHSNSPASTQKSIYKHIGVLSESLGRFPTLAKIRHVQKHGLQPRLFAQNRPTSDPGEFTRNPFKQSRKQLEIHLQAHRSLFRKFGAISNTCENPPCSKAWAIAQAFAQNRPSSDPSEFTRNPFKQSRKHLENLMQVYRSPFRKFGAISNTCQNPPCSKAWAIAQAFCSKSAKLGPQRIHPKSIKIVPQALRNPSACTQESFQKVWSDFQHLPKSAMFKSMSYSPGFLLKIGQVRTLANSPEIRPFHKLPKIFSEVAKINPKSCRKVANISEKLPKSC